MKSNNTDSDRNYDFKLGRFHNILSNFDGDNVSPIEVYALHRIGNYKLAKEKINELKEENFLHNQFLYELLQIVTNC